MLKTVTIGKYKMIALIDTGCDRNLIRRNAFDVLNIGLNKSYRIELSGIVNVITTTYGAIEIDMIIDGCQISTVIHVVANCVMPMDLMLGKDFLKKVIMIISRDEIKIFKNTTIRNDFSLDVLKQVQKLSNCKEEVAKKGVQQRKQSPSIVNANYNSTGQPCQCNCEEIISMYCELLVEYQTLLNEFQILQREFERVKHNLGFGRSLTPKIVNK